MRVLVTGFADYGSLVDAVNAARVHHYVEKPFHTVDLKTVVDALVRTSELEKEREDLFARLEKANAQLADRELHLQNLVESRTKELAEDTLTLSPFVRRTG